MSKEELKYLFSESSCLTPKQMKRYVRGGMANEESYAVELHLSSCPFCNEAVEGLFEQREGNAADVATHLSSDFLKDHFSLHQPRVHLNSMAPAHHPPQPVAHVQPRKRRRLRTDSVWKPSGIAAIVLLALGTIWFAKQRQQLNNAQATNAAMAVVEQSELENTGTEEKVLASADMVEIKDEPPVPIQMASIEGQSQQPQVQQLPLQAVQTVAVAEKDIKNAEQKLTESKPKPSTPARQEVVVSQYKAPTIDRPAQAPAETATAEKIPLRTMAAVPPTAGNSDSGDGHHTANADQPRKADASLSADDLYSQRKYSAALGLYKEQMSSAGSRGKRNYAALQAARCQLALGNKQSAIQLLQGIVSDGGNHKRAAKRLLEELGADKGE
ncbi:MAG: hypothetical protein K0R82_1391 [Flavipsychrobacter sp.]|nr:hypothetical protein [Flavipsychrobacter sp.]